MPLSWVLRRNCDRWEPKLLATGDDDAIEELEGSGSSRHNNNLDVAVLRSIVAMADTSGGDCSDI